MNEQQQSLQDLQQIKQMMERSSRFISLSGLSGVAAGVCALVGAWFANDVIMGSVDSGGIPDSHTAVNRVIKMETIQEFMGHRLIQIALFTFFAALLSSFLFTYLRSKKNNIPMWGYSSKRLLINVAIPMIAGGIYLFRQMQFGNYGLIAPGCLIFYGLALVNASKYTLGEIRYLGYCQILLGIINCWYVGNGVYFWAAGFGLLHIIYGLVMWLRYEKNNEQS